MAVSRKLRSEHRNAYLNASTYYIVLWGMLAMTGSFVAIDLHERGVTELQWGLMSASRSVVVLFATPLITRIADHRKQRVKFLTLTLFAMAGAMLLYMLPVAFPGFLAVSLLYCLVGTGLMPLGDGIIVRMAKRHNLEYGRLRMWGSIGWVIFGILGGVLWERLGYDLLYWISACLLVVIAFLSSRLEEPQAEPMKEIEKPAQRSSFGGFKGFKLLGKDWVLLLFLLACLFRSAAELMFHSYSALYINELTESAFFVGLMRGGAAVLEIFVMLVLQKLIRRFGMHWVLQSGFVVQALGIGIFAFNTNPWVMYLGTLLRSAGYALFFIAAVQFIDQRAGAENTATYQGLLTIIGGGIAPLLFTTLAGWVYQRWSGQWVFILATIAGGIAALIFLPILIRSPKVETISPPVE